MLCVFGKAGSCSQAGQAPCWVGVGAPLRGYLLGGDGGRASPVPPLLPLAALPGKAFWAGDSPLLGLGRVRKPSETKVSCADFERKQLVIQCIGNW